MIYVSQAHKALVVPKTAQTSQLMPRAKQLGADQLVVPHGVEETRFLRAIGHPAPSPILSHYNWVGTTPFSAQIDTAAMLTVNPRAYVLSEMGTGKTRAAVYAFDFLIRSRDVRKALVVAPLSTLTTVWERELFINFPNLKTAVLWGDRKRRLDRLASDADVYIINHDGLGVILSELEARKDIDCVVVDEISAFRNGRAKMHQNLKIVLKGRKYAWGMTGSPTPNAPTDAYGIAKLLTPHRVPNFYTHWRDRTMQQVSRFRWVARAGANELVHQALQPSVRFTLDEVKELPPTSYLHRTVPMEPIAQRLYDTMKTRMREMLANTSITAVNEGVLFSKLLQISCGYVYDDKKGVVHVPSAPRISALIETLEATDRKVLVFVPFVHACEGVFEALKNAGYDVALIHGATPKGKRDEIFTSFQNTTRYRVIVAHPETMAHGLTLTAANTTIWYSPTTSFEIYEQANARTRRPGQDSKTVVLHIQSTAADRAAYARLRKRQGMQGALLALFDGVNEENF